MNAELEGPAAPKHFPLPSYPQEVFPSTAAALYLLTWQALPPSPSSLSIHAEPTQDTPCTSPSTMNPPSSSLRELTGNPVSVTAWICARNFPGQGDGHEQLSRCNHLGNWVVLDISPLSPHSN